MTQGGARVRAIKVRVAFAIFGVFACVDDGPDFYLMLMNAVDHQVRRLAYDKLPKATMLRDWRELGKTREQPDRRENPFAHAFGGRWALSAKEIKRRAQIALRAVAPKDFHQPRSRKARITLACGASASPESSRASTSAHCAGVRMSWSPASSSRSICAAIASWSCSGNARRRAMVASRLGITTILSRGQQAGHGPAARIRQ